MCPKRPDTFDTQMRNHQVAWRNVPQNGINRELGSQNGHVRPWILPCDKWEQSLWPGIRTGSANPLPRYLDDNHIQPHQGKHNLNSSWVQCANLYFPFGVTSEGRELLSKVFSCVALDSRNDTLLNCLRTTGLPDLESGWASLFNSGSNVRFKVFTHQAWVAFVAQHGSPSFWHPWFEYVTARYGYLSTHVS